MYNENDEVIPNDNNEELIREIAKNCTYERLIIEDQHNCSRSETTLNKIIAKLRKHLVAP